MPHSSQFYHTKKCINNCDVSVKQTRYNAMFLADFILCIKFILFLFSVYIFVSMWKYPCKWWDLNESFWYLHLELQMILSCTTRILEQTWILSKCGTHPYTLDPFSLCNSDLNLNYMESSPLLLCTFQYKI